MAPTFEQATIRVEREKEFAELRGAIERVFSPPQLESFLRGLKKRSLGVRRFDAILNAGLIERVDKPLSAEQKTAKALYDSLSPSDQGLIREFYLERLEQVDASCRAKFVQVFRVI
jgi:hypothetical protein